MKVVILGKGLMLANIILGVKDAGADIVGVFRHEYTQKSRLQVMLEETFKPSPEVTLINQLKLNQIKLKSANSEAFQKLMVSLNVDLIIIGTWKELITPQTYNIPKIATVNVHPSLLPKYRGPNPYLQTILHGEKYSGVSIHLVNNEYDAGAILKQIKIPIYESDTSHELRERTVTQTRQLISEFLDDLNNRILTPVNQDSKSATYYPNITGKEMMLDFNTQTSDEISKTIRALHSFLPTYITYKNIFFTVNPYKFKVLNKISDYPPNTIISKNPNKNSITIVCKDKRCIEFNNLTIYKRKRVTHYIKKHVDVF